MLSTMGAPLALAAPDADAPPAVTSGTVKAETGLIKTTIPHTRNQLEGAAQNAYDGNFFEFSKNGGWSIGQDGTEEHYWSKNPANADEAKRDLWYEVEFSGSSIDIYSGKNHMMGKVRYTVDGDPNHTLVGNLYSPTNKTCELIGTIDGLTEGRHTLRAEAMGEKDPLSSNYTIDCAKVVVEHSPYEVTALESADEKSGIDLKEAGEVEIELTAEPDYVSDADLVFESKDSSIATVNEDGVVTAVSVGETEVTVTPKAVASGSKAANALKIPVRVTEAPLLDGFISDVDTQWTQDRYGEAIEEIEENDARATDRAKHGRVDDRGTLTAWKNDSAISEITLATSSEGVENVTIEASAFTTEDGEKIAAENVDLSFIGSTKAYNGRFLGYGNQPHKYPQPTEQNRSESNDILLGSDPVDVAQGKLQNIFVKVNVPKDAKPGTYSGVITVTADGMGDALEFAYELKVQDAELPDATEFGKTFDAELWQYPYSSAEYYGVEPFSDEHFEILRPIMEIYKSMGGHAITTTIVEEAWSGQTYADPDADGGHDDKIHYPSMIRWQLDENGVMTYDFTNFDKWVKFNQELGIGDKIVLYSIAPWHNSIKYYDAKGNLVTVNASKVGQAEGNKYWRHFLQALVEHLEENGWFDMAYMAIDERGITHEAFDMVESVRNSEGESLKTAGAMDGITGDARVALAMRIDDLNIGDFAAESAKNGYDELIEKRNAAGLRTTLYSCTEHYPGNFSLSNPVESYWSIINAEKDGNTSGFLRWAYDAWVDDPLNDATHWAFEAGDCFLIYPGADKATVEKAKAEGRELTDAEKTAKSSVRLERMAEGLRDANKIKKMRAEVTDMTDDIQSAYDKIATKANKRTNRDWTKVDQEMAQLDAEMSQFKLDLATLTDTYIAARDAQGAVAQPSKIAIEGADTVAVGKTVQLTAKLSPQDALAQGVEWRASNIDVATVSTKGVVTGLKAGTCAITATSTANGEVAAMFEITVVPATAEVPDADVSDARVAHYNFEKDAKDDWFGSARAEGAQDGTVNGATFEGGKLGKGVRVNAAENKTVSLPDDQYGLDGDHSWTVAYWVKSNALLDKQVLPLIDEQAQYAFALRLGDASHRANPGFRVGPNDGDVLSFGPGGYFKPDTWYRVTWVQDVSKGLTMYVNGKQVGDTNVWTKNNKGRIKVPVDVIGGNGFDGVVDELAIYNRALTKNEVAAQLHEFSPEEEPGDQPLVSFTKKTVYDGDSFGITGNFDKTAKFEVVKTVNIAGDKGDVVEVSEDGYVTALQRGYADIKVTCNGKSATIKVTVKKNMAASNMLTPILVDQSEDAGFISDIYDPRDDGNFEAGKKYYGQPDMVRTRTGRLITAFPQGHGHGPLLMRYSDDQGATWTEFEKALPSDWSGSQETPTLYCLDMPDGTERIMMITACPGWGTDSDGNATGWNTSYSDDNGETWTEYRHWYTDINGKPNKSIVGMASLIQLHDPKTGKPIHKWMGVYHDYDYVNYKTYLTFDENGEEHWTEPVPYLSDHRDIEQAYQMCEIGMFRSPDGGTIVGLARSQSHNNPSTLIMSTDEGETWSRPIDLPGSLAGERHKAMYDPITGKLIITFREIQYDLDYDNKFEGGNDWICNSWGMWVGSYEQLINQEQGDHRFRLSEDWTRNRYKGDTGYTGLTVNPETGLFVMDSYGHWDRAVSESMNPYNVKKDLSYIRQARFGLNSLLDSEGLPQHEESERSCVIFVFNNGKDSTDVEWTDKGTAVRPPADPIRKGHAFTGWYLNEDCTGAPYDFKTPLDNGTKLYAGWKEPDDVTPIEAYVTFDLNFEGAPALDPVKVNEDGTVTAPADPTREGYVFGGWFTDAQCSEAFDFSTKLDGNAVLYAKWVKAEEWIPIGPSEPVGPDKPVDPDGPGDGNGNKPGTGNGNEPGTGGGDKPGSSLPQTGDSAPLVIGGLAAASAVALGGAAVTRRKRSV